MADAELPDPEPSDFVILHDDIHEIARRLESVVARFDQLVASHNAIGENVAWLVANTQGIFQMLNNPDMMNQMMSSVLGGVSRGGRPETGPES